MRPSSLEGWRATQDPLRGPFTTRYGCHGLADVGIEGPSDDGTMVLTIESHVRAVAALDVSALANHLRLAGWTVTPPEEQL